MDTALIPAIKPQWFHPLLEKEARDRTIDRGVLEAFAYRAIYVRFMPFFRKQPEGDLLPRVSRFNSTRA
jgi:hypothetical protein